MDIPMPYQEMTQYTSKNFTPASNVAAVFGQPRKVQSITIHWWGAYGQKFFDVVNFLCTNNTPTSAHYVAEAGRVACLVSPDDAAWHSGNAAGNATSIGIECRPEASVGDYATTAELIANLRKAYGNIPLRAHRDWFPTACPGVWDLDRLDKLARAGTITPQSTQEDDNMSAADVEAIKKHINAVLLGGYSWEGKKHPGVGAVAEENQRRITALSEVVRQLASKQGVVIDYAKIEAIVDKSIADADLLTTGDVVSVDVNVTGK